MARFFLSQKIKVVAKSNGAVLAKGNYVSGQGKQWTVSVNGRECKYPKSAYDIEKDS